MNITKIYRHRLIPAELLQLKDDVIVNQNEDYLLTKWKTLHPKHEFSHGSSCYFFKEGIKVSKFYRPDNTLLYWYIDIVDYSFDESENSMTATDLLADVVIYPDGRYQVVDLDELAEAFEKELITRRQMIACLNNLNHLLSMVSRDKFDRFQNYLDSVGL